MAETSVTVIWKTEPPERPLKNIIFVISRAFDGERFPCMGDFTGESFVDQLAPDPVHWPRESVVGWTEFPDFPKKVGP